MRLCCKSIGLIAQCQIIKCERTTIGNEIERHWLQVERGTTATYLSSGGANTDAYARLLETRKITDAALDELESWLKSDWFSDEDLSTRAKFNTYLKNYRDGVRVWRSFIFPNHQLNFNIYSIAQLQSKLHKRKDKIRKLYMSMYVSTERNNTHVTWYRFKA